MPPSILSGPNGLGGQKGVLISRYASPGPAFVVSCISKGLRSLRLKSHFSCCLWLLLRLKLAIPDYSLISGPFCSEPVFISRQDEARQLYTLAGSSLRQYSGSSGATCSPDPQQSSHRHHPSWRMGLTPTYSSGQSPAYPSDSTTESSQTQNQDQCQSSSQSRTPASPKSRSQRRAQTIFPTRISKRSQIRLGISAGKRHLLQRRLRWQLLLQRPRSELRRQRRHSLRQQHNRGFRRQSQELQIRRAVLRLKQKRLDSRDLEQDRQVGENGRVVW